MASGFVSSKEIDEERKNRQEEWEKVRKPDDPADAPEPEVCNKTLFEQLRDNRNAKQAEIDEAKKFKNMIRGVDEDESEFLAQVNSMKNEAEKKKKLEELEMIKEMAKTQTISSMNQKPVSLKPSTSAGVSNVSKQASILSSAIKRKSTASTEDSDAKIKKSEGPMIKAGVIPGIIDYAESSDSHSSSDSDDEETSTIPVLKVAQKQNSKQQ